jgi:MoxR-like ATPase
MNDAIGFVRNLSDAVLAELGKVIVGQEEILEHILIALYARGHVLIEGVPGTAKTLMVRALALALSAEFKRVQFTPDLMPSDILGTNVFNLQEGRFHLVRGPIFTDLLLSDEVNRAPAKTQSALLEAMEERRVTIDGQPHPLSPFFTVFATQNPIEYEGTYPLPEAQLDRFLFKLKVSYPSAEEEDAILRRFDSGFDPGDLAAAGVKAVAAREHLARARQIVYGTPGTPGVVRVPEAIAQYIRKLVRATRESPSLSVGGGPRASIALLQSAKAHAALQGRDFVTPDDVKALAYPVLRHRLVLDPEAEIDGTSPEEVMDAVFQTVEVPR